MPEKTIMAEIAELQAISERLTLIADDHPTITDALITVASHINTAATLLALVLKTKLVASGGQGHEGADGHKPH